MKKKSIKLVVLVAFGWLSLSFITHAEGILVHQSFVQGLQSGERLLIRTDNKNSKNGKVFQSGYFVACVDNGWLLFDAQIFSSQSVAEHYQYDVSYSLCHSLAESQYEDNRCEVLTSMQINAYKNEHNEVSVSTPLYFLNLALYSGESSPCSQNSTKASLITAGKAN
ncbi:MAG: hypothetical protein CK426_04720 [Legionella sp.]|nr:MAG: hypothetical protein CK423_04085 [Legionella sp.]PJD98791.1 MAG: hypothetical protein CK426_04720 [Legionella sp.]